MEKMVKTEQKQFYVNSNTLRKQEMSILTHIISQLIVQHNNTVQYSLIYNTGQNRMACCPFLKFPPCIIKWVLLLVYQLSFGTSVTTVVLIEMWLHFDYIQWTHLVPHLRVNSVLKNLQMTSQRCDLRARMNMMWV